MNALPVPIDLAVAVLLVVGAFFTLVGSIGLVRLPDFFMRLHAPTKASTLGVGGVLLASMLTRWSQGEWAVPELLITLFLFVTAPVSANLMAKAALHLKVSSRAGGEPPEEGAPPRDERHAPAPGAESGVEGPRDGLNGNGGGSQSPSGR